MQDFPLYHLHSRGVQMLVPPVLQAQHSLRYQRHLGTPDTPILLAFEETPSDDQVLLFRIRRPNDALVSSTATTQPLERVSTNGEEATGVLARGECILRPFRFLGPRGALHELGSLIRLSHPWLLQQGGRKVTGSKTTELRWVAPITATFRAKYMW